MKEPFNIDEEEFNKEAAGFSHKTPDSLPVPETAEPLDSETIKEAVV
ncbi:MAG: hypothetical protein HY099_07365, partial [Nitrospirae bacterium]|nr:hypothetical protein [Nitrospirota bacterium]